MVAPYFVLDREMKDAYNHRRVWSKAPSSAASSLPRGSSPLCAPGEVGNHPKSSLSIVTPTSEGGAGFDVVQHDGLRSAVRNAVESAWLRTTCLRQLRRHRQQSLSLGLYPWLAGGSLR